MIGEIKYCKFCNKEKPIYDDFKRYLNNQDEVRITKQFRKRR